MTTYRRLFGLLAPHRRWIAIGALLGFLAVASNVALMAMSAYLISKAAIVTNVAAVALAITGVRVLAIGRAAFRYLERYTTHRATFAILADLRVWFFASIEPLAPARLAGRRSGDLLARIVADIETLEDFYVRVIVPPVVAVLVTALAGSPVGSLRPDARRRARRLPPARGGRPARSSRGASHVDPPRALIASRADLSAMLVDEVGGHGRPGRARSGRRPPGTRSWARGAEQDRATARLALVRAGTDALAATFASLAGVTVLAIGVGLVGAGRLDGVFLAVLPLVAVASFEVIAAARRCIPAAGCQRGSRATAVRADRRGSGGHRHAGSGPGARPAARRLWHRDPPPAVSV